MQSSRLRSGSLFKPDVAEIGIEAAALRALTARSLRQLVHKLLRLQKLDGSAQIVRIAAGGAH